MSETNCKSSLKFHSMAVQIENTCKDFDVLKVDIVVIKEKLLPVNRKFSKSKLGFNKHHKKEIMWSLAMVWN